MSQELISFFFFFFQYSITSSPWFIAFCFMTRNDFLFFRTKRAQQVSSPLPSSLDPCTPTKAGLRTGSKVTPDMQTSCPEPSKVTFSSELDLLAELYCTCISGKWPQDGVHVLGKGNQKEKELNVFYT